MGRAYPIGQESKHGGILSLLLECVGSEGKVKVLDEWARPFDSWGLPTFHVWPGEKWARMPWLGPGGGPGVMGRLEGRNGYKPGKCIRMITSFSASSRRIRHITGNEMQGKAGGGGEESGDRRKIKGRGDQFRRKAVWPSQIAMY